MPNAAHRAYARVPDSELSFDCLPADASTGWNGDIVCFSNLRWEQAFQRPNQLMARFAERQRVFFVEEIVHDDRATSRMETFSSPEGVVVCVPHLPNGTDVTSSVELMRRLFQELRTEHRIDPDVLWFYTPMALEWVRHERERVVVYDCMDELSTFTGASPALTRLEQELLTRADLVFTGGYGSFEAKRTLHRSVHAFPSSVDAAHFSSARAASSRREPADQAVIPRPRLGFSGVIDERLDLELVDRVARMRPEWSWVFLGPVVKVDPAVLPRGRNIHWLGIKPYDELPHYIAGWDVAIMPFLIDAATRSIRTTATLEYLAAGRAIVSTAVPDLLPYRDLGLLRIADEASFASAVEAALAEGKQERWQRADRHLATTSWDRTWQAMADLVDWRLLQYRQSPASVDHRTTL